MLLNSSIGRKERRERAKAALAQVGLRPEDVDNFPHEFSGGQRQRVAIARAIASSPRLIVLDEPVSSLDVSIRAQIMNLLKSLQEVQGFSYLFIAHHLGTVRYMSQMVGVMYLGRLMELSESEELFENPLHPYTQALVHRRPARSPRYRAQGRHAAERRRGRDRYPERMPAAHAMSVRQARVQRSRTGMETGRAQSLDRLSSLLTNRSLRSLPLQGAPAMIPVLSRDGCLEALRKMLLIRRFEEACIDAAQERKVPGHFHVYIGQEATGVGVASVLDKGDYVHSTHRNHGHLLARGADPKKALAEILGKATGYAGGKAGTLHGCAPELNFPLSSGIVAGILPISTGTAFALKHRGPAQRQRGVLWRRRDGGRRRL